MIYLLLLIFPYLANRTQCRIMIKKNLQTETGKKKKFQFWEIQLQIDFYKNWEREKNLCI